ncbi:nucleotide-binding universal stress UspA family protein [Wenyingzhuangia heitensis]|uniref:Nucleotide-binding universal stress UspA family protein n=1 Tax=Wenyingzhuangia heitensis TaxID=1487859 RepID=A0ABX0UC21_9FLAO|nr:universal stress protein [Wenyingzhuangia heitensis]NIJ46379.1 nucleotide-binding universal stress UspA family protein [Wenyingzhuangia heitensis]
MKKIIVPIDFTEYSEYALQTAVSVAERHDIHITLITMIRNPASFSEETITDSKDNFLSIQQAELKMKEFVNQDYLKNVSFDYVIKHYRIFSELGGFAEDLKGDLIIMGTLSSNSLKDFFLGSNTEKAVRTTEIPVLVVKETEKEIDLKKTLFVSNYRSKAVVAYKKAMKIFNALNIKPTLLFVNKFGDKFLTPEAIKERIEEFLLKADGNLDNLSSFKSIDSKSVGRGTHTFAAEHHIGFIAMTTQEKTSIGKFLKKSKKFNLSDKNNYPIMSVKMG